MSDGVEVALTLFLPDDPSGGPWPVVLEAVPYRKDDHTAARDAQLFTYLAARGIAGARLDVRGTGASDGVAVGEYVPREQADNVEVLAWLAAQPWCSGRMGMWGMSWGGFAALQTAMLRPPGLEAICAMHATHDRFATDVHYLGGALHGFEQVDWPVAMLATNSLPPDPAIVGDRWLDAWIGRLDATPQWLPDWLSHQRRDAFWEHGSPAVDYASVEAATLLVGGWLDPYVDGIVALLEHLDAPKRAVIGPWGHHRPADGRPGPSLDHRELLYRWFAEWLGVEVTGVMDTPLLTFFARSGAPYDDSEGTVAGTWRSEPQWPPADAERRTLHLTRESLTTGREPGDAVRSWSGPWTAGATNPSWSRGGLQSEDTDADDQVSLVWETEPLIEPVEVLGTPAVEATVSVDDLGGRLCAVLVDVDPSGHGSLVTRGALNLSHRDDPANPSDEPVDEPFPVTVPMHATSATFAVGHRIRLVLRGTDFPIVWPPPRPVTLSIHPGSRLHLPVVPPGGAERHHDIAPAPPIENPAKTLVDSCELTITRDGGKVKVEKETEWAEHHPAFAELTHRWRQVAWMSADGDSPTSAVAGSVVEAELSRPGWTTKVTTSAGLAADEDAFHLDIAINAFSNGVEIWARRWVESVPREWT